MIRAVACCPCQLRLTLQQPLLPDGPGFPGPPGARHLWAQNRIPLRTGVLRPTKRWGWAGTLPSCIPHAIARALSLSCGTARCAKHFPRRTDTHFASAIAPCATLHPGKCSAVCGCQHSQTPAPKKPPGLCFDQNRSRSRPLGTRRRAEPLRVRHRKELLWYLTELDAV